MQQFRTVKISTISSFFKGIPLPVGEPLGRIHGEKEDSYWKLIYKLSLLLAKLDLKVLSTKTSKGFEQFGQVWASKDN